jgi:hypothetical protein
VRLADARRPEQHDVLSALDKREAPQFWSLPRGALLAKPKAYCSSILMLGNDASFVSVCRLRASRASNFVLQEFLGSVPWVTRG